MQNRCLNTNIAKTTFAASHIEGARGDTARCCSGYSGLLYIIIIINVELTVPSAWLITPLFLIHNKYYVSQDSIVFKGILPLSYPRALCLARNVPSRAVFVALDFSDKGAYDETTI